MVKFTAIAIAIMATVSPFAVADNCRAGLYYCGYNLLHKGNYYSQIMDALQGAGYSTDRAHVENTLFYCVGGKNGDIRVIEYCNQCEDGGPGRNDFCA